MRRPLLTTCPLFVLGAFVLAGCDRDKGPGPETRDAPTAAAVAGAITADAMAAQDPGPGRATDPAQADDQPRPVMKAQVVLDRLGFSPGAIDGTMTPATINALRGFQQANALEPTGLLDDPTLTVLSRWSQINATRMVTIPADFARGPFAPPPAPGYASLDEKLAERFHTTIATLRALNGAAAQAAFVAGQTIRVPNVGADAIDATRITDAAWLRTLVALGVGTDQTALDRVVVNASRGTLSGYDAGGKLVALFSVTAGSRDDPLPLGRWTIAAIDHNPSVAGAPSGPNGPVGVVRFALLQGRFALHGTADPDSIGQPASGGGVRLTNWDAARLAQMVSTATRVESVP